MRTLEKLEKLVSNQADSSVSVDEKGRRPFLFPTYLGRSKGLCSQGIGNMDFEFSSNVVSSKQEYPTTVLGEIDCRVN